METNDLITTNENTKAKSFTCSFSTTRSPEEIFELLLDVNKWWSGFHKETITGKSTSLNDEFSFLAGGGVHFSKQRLIELVPHRKIVWLVIESNLTFLGNPNEWLNTKIRFDITKQEEKTIVKFTHEGLIPRFECYSDCSMAWAEYMEQLEQMLNENTSKQINMNNKDYTATILVDATPEKAYRAIKDFRAWWSEEIEGPTDQLNEEFFYHYKDIHLCKMKLVEMDENKKLVYQVLENEFNFITDQTEWVDTRLIFEITKEDGKTKVKFTHQGLVPDYECYEVCNDAWTGYITNSLYKLITTGKGEPNPKDKDGFNAELAEKWKLN